MAEKKNIFALSGSASSNSANEKLIEYFASLTLDFFKVRICDDLKTLPHFDPELSTANPPQEIIQFRNNIEKSDGVLICTPEYVYSIPSGLKNAIEWCVSTTVFTGKPIGLITAAAGGQKGHEELQLIMRTVMTKFTSETTLLIPGIKGKIDEQGKISSAETKVAFLSFIDAFKMLVGRS